MTLIYWPDKDPDEVLDYQLDWSARLDGDTISTVTWTVPVGLTKGAESNTTTSATVWLSSGTLHQTYSIGCRITTAAGRTMDQTIKLRIKSR